MPGKRIRFNEFELDFSRFQLSCGGKPVHLEGLPLQLLMLLVDKQDQVLTRDEIAEALWGKDVFVDIEQGINTAIRKIRLALQDDYAQPRYLRTIVGRGYRFVAATSIDGDGEAITFSAEELGRAIMAAAGLDPSDPSPLPKPPDES